MQATIVLKGKKYKLHTPSTYAAQLMREWHDDPAGGTCIAIAATMTACEPMDTHYVPKKVWYPGEVALLLPKDVADCGNVASAVYDLLKDAGILGGEKSDAPVDPPIPGDDSPSAPADTSEISA